jgi:hypothetical protein
VKQNLGALVLIVLVSLPAWCDDHLNPLHGRTVQIDNEETIILRGKSPRSDGLSYEYEKMQTPLRGNFIISDVLLPTDKWHLWDGSPTPRFDVSKQTPENYHQSHNHYQNLLSEVVNATSGANSIPVWGESIAAVKGANAWGGFFSARSGCYMGDLVSKHFPKDIDRGCGKDFDAQLTGVEVDVLNAGKPGVFPNKAKHGVQVVGFGNPNGQALSIISENFDREPQYRRGQFESILYAQNSLQPDYGRFIVMDFEKAQIGLDMRKPLFSKGAMDFHSQGLGTGILLDSGHSGELYGGLRWPGFKDPHGWLTARLGEGGFRIVSNDNTHEIMAIDNNGGIYLNGDLYLNGTKAESSSGDIRIPKRALLIAGILGVLVLMVANILLVRFMVRFELRKRSI